MGRDGRRRDARYNPAAILGNAVFQNSYHDAVDESDDSVVDRWVQNPYWPYFSGFTHMQYEAPIDRGSMTRWRKRVSAEPLELLLRETIDLAVRARQLPKRGLTQITIDTRVQENNITHPPDSKLLCNAICILG